jgi:hypothetical protein
MDREYTVEFKVDSENPDQGELLLIKNGQLIDSSKVPITAHLDSMLIKTLDKLLQKNRIKALSLKTLNLSGKMRQNGLSESVLRAIKAALDY